MYMRGCSVPLTERRNQLAERDRLLEQENSHYDLSCKYILNSSSNVSSPHRQTSHYDVCGNVLLSSGEAQKRRTNINTELNDYIKLNEAGCRKRRCVAPSRNDMNVSVLGNDSSSTENNAHLYSTRGKARCEVAPRGSHVWRSSPAGVNQNNTTEGITIPNFGKDKYIY